MKQDEKKLDSIITFSLWIVIIALILPAALYFSWFYISNDQVLSTNAAVWGAFGDFIGGILNPLVALSALMMLFTSVKIQQRELRAAHKALSDSSESQAEQVKLSSAQAEITVNQMTFDKINIDLKTKLEYRAKLISDASSDAIDSTLTVNGKRCSIVEAIDIVNKDIDSLYSQQKQVVSITESIIDALRK